MYNKSHTLSKIKYILFFLTTEYKKILFVRYFAKRYYENKYVNFSPDRAGILVKWSGTR